MTVDYFNHQYDQGLEALSILRQETATVGKWGMKTTDDHYERSAALFLYMGALSTYDPTAVFNFLTEAEIQFIIEQVRTLIGISDNDTIQAKRNQYS
jgi:hypothetical protein